MDGMLATAESILASPLAANLLLVIAVVYVERQRQSSISKFEAERTRWRDALKQNADAMEALRDALYRR